MDIVFKIINDTLLSFAEIYIYLAYLNIPILRTLEVVAILSATYFAARSVRFAKESVYIQKQIDAPAIVVFVKQAQDTLHIVNLVIRNEGRNSARNISFEVIGDNLKVLNNRTLSEISLITNGISLLAGGESISHPLNVMLGESFDEYKSSKTSLKVSYDDMDGNKMASSYDLDFNGLIDVKIGQSDLEKVANSLDGIHKELGKIRKYSNFKH